MVIRLLALLASTRAQAPGLAQWCNLNGTAAFVPVNHTSSLACSVATTCTVSSSLNLME